MEARAVDIPADVLERARERIRSRVLRDCGFREFVVSVMGFDGSDPELPDYTDPSYDAVFESVERWLWEDGILLLPRGTGKTTLMALFVLWLGLRDANDRILLLSDPLKNACDILNMVRGWMLWHPGLREVFGTSGHLPKHGDKKWGSSERLDFPKRAVAAGVMEGTIEAASVDQKLAGRHYKRRIGDDLVNPQTVTTPEQVLKTRRDWEAKANLLVGSNKRSLLVGTRYLEGDLYGDQMKRYTLRGFVPDFVREQAGRDLEPGHKPSDLPFWTCVIPAREEGELDGKAVFRHLDDRALRERLINSSVVEFAGQMLLNPMPDGTNPFQEKWFRDAFYKMSEVWVREGMEWKIRPEFEVAITCDLAISLDPKNDRTAIIVSATDPRGHIYILEVWVGRVLPQDGVRVLASFISKYRPAWIGTEPGALRLAYEAASMEWNADHEQGPRIYWTDIETGGGKKKARTGDRNLLIAAYASQGKIHFLPTHIEAVFEVCRYPNARFDDVTDALAFRCHNSRRPMAAKPPEPEKEKSVGEQIRERVLAASRSQEAGGWY